MAKLVVKGPNGRDEVLTLKEGVHRFGRSPANDFVVFDSTVSRFHCEIEVRPDGMWVRDLDSANGTFVNDVPVTEPTQLHKGQVLRLGTSEWKCVTLRNQPSRRSRRCVPFIPHFRPAWSARNVTGSFAAVACI
ncbi:MAG: FHA domain-containing protein [Verrucomicrobiota bacterium]|nr:FHA domain-containing protein [Limisphaera sp.]MDW8382649.1 FHA domain-containing protein [Verrucomicrobiota bacterium]